MKDKLQKFWYGITFYINKKLELLKKRNIKLGTGLIILMSIIGVSAFIDFIIYMPYDANTVVTLMKNNLNLLSLNTIKNYTILDDPDHLLGQKYQYISKSSLTEYKVTVEMFDSSQALQLRLYYLENLNARVQNDFLEYFSLADDIRNQYKGIYSSKNAILIIGNSSRALYNCQKTFEAVMSNINFKDKKILSEQAYQIEIEKLNAKIDEQIAKYDSLLAQQATDKKEEYEKKVVGVEKALTTSELEKVRDFINTTPDKNYFEADIIAWNKRLDAVEIAIKDAEIKKKTDFIASCQFYDYNDIMRFPDSYLNKNVHFQGLIDDIETYEAHYSWNNQTIFKVYVTYQNGSWINPIYITNPPLKYENGGDILKGDVIDIYGTCYGKQGDIKVDNMTNDLEEWPTVKKAYIYFIK